MFLTEIPLIATLILAIIYTDTAGGLLGLYPLIVAVSLGIVAIFVYLFRVIIISFEEVKIIGLFSSKDKAIINKGKTLILTQRKRGRLKVTLFGNDGQRPALDWASTEDYELIDINLFRESAVGGCRAILRTAGYFGIPKDTAMALLNGEADAYETDELTATVTTREGEKDLRILFKKTI